MVIASPASLAIKKASLSFYIKKRQVDIQKVDKCARLLVYMRSGKRSGSLAHQVMETGVFKPDKISQVPTKK
jgi:hypothetical protein